MFCVIVFCFPVENFCLVQQYILLGLSLRVYVYWTHIFASQVVCRGA
jgi:hypothetical protein